MKLVDLLLPAMPSQKRKFGDIGEKVALYYLQNKGYAIIDKNYLKKFGEIDIIGKIGDKIVFFEVKARKKFHVEHYLPENSIDHKKIRKLRKICELYLTENQYHYTTPWQIDVLSIKIDETNETAHVKHIENAIWGKNY